MKNKVAIIGGGTYQPITNHLGICSFAKGSTAKKLYKMFLDTKLRPFLYVSDMCNSDVNTESFKTNQDLSNLINKIKQDPETKIIVLSAAICDFKYPNGSDNTERPDTNKNFVAEFVAEDKIVRTIRDNDHKHIFLVAFKNTVNKSPDQMYKDGLALCKKASANLVFVNDTVTKRNMIVTPEEAAYADGWDRNAALRELVEMTIARSHLSFTRSTVVSGATVPWSSEEVPISLRTVVDYCIKNKAYKEFNGATVGHFAVKVNDTTFLTSIRRSNFNDLEKVGLVKVVTDGPDDVYAYGAKPSVGGQSQRIVFGEHQGYDCILHYHCPLLPNPKDDIPIRSQREVECGSHQCGQQTSNGLKQFGNLKAVMLENHGPNIVFNRNIDPNEIISFIDKNFDLTQKTGGYNL